MTRKRSRHYRPREARAPMLVVMSTTDLELQVRNSVQAFAQGYATEWHFDNLADCHDMLMLAYQMRPDPQIPVTCEVSEIALLNIKGRYAKTGRFGIAGEELKALQLLADTDKDYWSRQSGAIFSAAWSALKMARKAQQERRAAA